MTVVWLALSIVVYVALAVLALLLTLLAVPFQLRAAGDVDEEQIRGEASASWAFGLVAIDASPDEGVGLRIGGVRVARLPADTRKEKKRKKRRDKRRRGESPSWWFERRAVLWRGVKRLLASLRLRISLRGAVGLADPADTVLCIGVLHLVAASAQWADLQVTPSYVDETVRLAGRASARVWLGHMVLIILFTVALPLLWRAMTGAFSGGSAKHQLARGV